MPVILLLETIEERREEEKRDGVDPVEEKKENPTTPIEKGPLLLSFTGVASSSPSFALDFLFPFLSLFAPAAVAHPAADAI